MKEHFFFDVEIKNFYDHIALEGNSRILFSAPFGVGKTTFLKAIATEEKQKEHLNSTKYKFFHLNPVNYSISTNEDVLKSLKYDIIYSLIEKGIQFQQKDFVFSDIALAYVKKHPTEVLAPLFVYTGKTGKDVFELYKDLKKFTDKIEKLKSKANEDEGERLYEYLNMMKASDGLYEFDIYTDTITQILNRIKEEDKQENILVIDDLDRIDPEHIFRLLNVFSAHVNNKFGFDKVVFVCDLENIKSIYHHLYGEGTDFYGYMDKFYSDHIYNFDNGTVLKMWIENKIRELPNKNIFDQGDQECLFDILHYLIKNDFINFRAIEKVDTQKMVKDRTFFRHNNHSRFTSCAFLKICTILKYMVGDTEALLDLLHDIKSFHQVSIDKSIFDDSNRIVGFHKYYIVPILHVDAHNWRRDATFQAAYGALRVNYKLESSPSTVWAETDDPMNIANLQLEFWSRFITCVNRLDENRLL